MMVRDHFRALGRRSVGAAAKVVVLGDSTSPELRAKVVDLGLGGACLELARPIPEGAGVRVSLEAPHLWEPLLVTGQIAWSQPGEARSSARVGVRFEAAAGTTLRALVELLEAEAFD
jgi:Tfp pilus assembly protein PilZ